MHEDISCGTKFEEIDFKKADLQHLYKVAPFINENKTDIVKSWASLESNKFIFEKFEIDSSIFQVTFGIPVVEYFIGVLDRTKELGNCPIMQKFINFLVEKDINARDIFILCMGLRRTIFNYLIQYGQFTQTLDICHDEFSDVFDTNLSGVLHVFTEIRDKRELEVQQEQLKAKHNEKLQKVIKKQKKQLQQILNFQASSLCVLKNEKITIANKAFLEMIGIKSLQYFQDDNTYSLSFLSKKETKTELKEPQEYQEWFKQLLDDKKDAKVVIYNKIKNNYKNYNLHISKVPESEEEFILSFIDVEEYEEKLQNLQEKAFIDPITNIANNLKYEESLKNILLNKETENKDIMVLHLNLDFYDSEHFSIDTINTIMKHVTDFLKDILPSYKLLSRTSSSDFSIILEDLAEDKVKILAKFIKDTLSTIEVGVSNKIVSNILLIKPQEDDCFDDITIRQNKLLKEVYDLGGNLILDDAEIFNEMQTLKQQEGQIFNLLEKQKKKKTPFDSYFLFEETTLSNNLQIQTINPRKGTVTFKILNQNIKGLDNGEVHLTYKGFNLYIAGQTVESNTKNRTITIAHLIFTENSFNQRNQLRVTTQLFFSVNLKYKKSMLLGYVSNISLNSILLITKDIGSLTMGQKVVIESSLQKDEKIIDIVLEGVATTIKRTKGDYHIVVSFEASSDLEKKLTEYISWRQLSIARQYKNLTQLA